jgi:hypothetical protein
VFAVVSVPPPLHALIASARPPAPTLANTALRL